MFYYFCNKKMKNLIIPLLFTLLFSCNNNQPIQKVFFKNIHDGQILTSPFLVKMGVEGMEVEKSGEVNENKGHHHIIINSTFIRNDEIIPVDQQHIHYGDGQTEAILNLEKGNYTLTLQFADGLHQSYGKKMSKTISISIQ